MALTRAAPPTDGKSRPSRAAELGSAPSLLCVKRLGVGPFLADDASQRGWCGPALRLEHAAVVGELQSVVFVGSQLRGAPTTTAASAAIADVVASTCSPGDAAWSMNTQV